MPIQVDDVTNVFGSDMDVEMEKQFIKKLERELPPAYYDRYVRNLQIEDIGIVVNEFGDVVLGDRFGIMGLGETLVESDTGVYTLPDDPFLKKKVFVPYVSMAGYKKALVLNILSIYVADAPKAVRDAVKKALEQVKEMEIHGQIDGLELGDISGWWDGFVKAFQHAGSAIAHAAGSAAHAIQHGASAAAHAIQHGAANAWHVVTSAAEKAAKGAVWAGKKVAGAIVGGIKWMADQVKKVGTKLFNAITQRDKALKKLNEWKGVIKMYADLIDKAQREGKKISPDHAKKLALHIANWKKAAKKLGAASDKLEKYKKTYERAKKKAPLTTIASVKNGKRYLQSKNIHIPALHGTEGIEEMDYKVGEIGFVVATAVIVTAIAATAAVIIALLAFMNKGEKRTKEDYHQLLNEYKTSETGEYEVEPYPYDPNKDPPSGYVEVPDPTDPSRTIKALRVRDKIYLPKVTRTESHRMQSTSWSKSTEEIGGISGLLNKLILFGGVMFGLYIGGQLVLGLAESRRR